MTVEKLETPLVPPSRSGLVERMLRALLPVAVRVSLWFSPRPAALLVRRVFAAGGAKTAEALDRHAPADVIAVVDERYGDEPDMLLDAYRPASATTPLPLVLWVHGGGFVGGAKEELAGYFKLLAHGGYVVVAPRYSLAPDHHYPTPPRQVMQALGYLTAHAERMLIDPDRIVLYPDDHQPPLGHEYQFDLDTGPGRLFLDRLGAFLRQRLKPPGP